MRHCFALTLALLGASIGHAEPVFQLAIAQGGVERPITDHQVTLKPAPFEVILYFNAADDAVLLNAADDPRALRAVEAGQGPEIAFKGQTGMAEDPLNPDAELILGDAPHYLYFSGDTDHRFTQIKRLADGRIRCARAVKQLRQGGAATPIEARRAPLHLALLATRWKPDYSGQIVRQRGGLTIQFQGAPPPKAPPPL
ncbi:hypothetical protein KKF91_15800 [Myxococcota bacterium]|nr:hypothetical protein [Myxococcota bacterium]